MERRFHLPMWLGESRGHLIDWSTQKWVQTTGCSIDLAAHPWLAGPVGPTRGIGLDYFDRWAAAAGLRVERHPSGKGLLPSFAALAGNGFDPASVDPAVAEFYEKAADFDLDVWSEWCGLFRPFGLLVSAVFSRRLQPPPETCGSKTRPRIKRRRSAASRGSPV